MRLIIFYLITLFIISCTDPTIPNEDIRASNCEKSIRMLDGAKLEGIIGFCVPDKNYKDNIDSEGEITILENNNVQFHLYTIDEFTNYDTTYLCSVNCVFGLDYEPDSLSNEVTFINFDNENDFEWPFDKGQLHLLEDYRINLYFEIDGCLPFGQVKGYNKFSGYVRF